MNGLLTFESANTWTGIRKFVPEVGLEPTRLAAADFESAVSAIPPLGRAPPFCHLAPTSTPPGPCPVPLRSAHYPAGVLGFVTGIVVGVAFALLAVIVIGPSRRVRAEPPLDLATQLTLLLGQEPTPEVIAALDEIARDTDWTFDTTQIAALRDLGADITGDEHSPAEPTPPTPSDHPAEGTTP